MAALDEPVAQKFTDQVGNEPGTHIFLISLCLARPRRESQPTKTFDIVVSSGDASDAMSEAKALAEQVAEALEGLGVVSVRPFFGGFGLWLDGLQFGVVMDTLYFVTAPDQRDARERTGAVPFSYRTAKRQVVVKRYYSVPDESLDDTPTLKKLASDALRASAATKRSRSRQ